MKHAFLKAPTLEPMRFNGCCLSLKNSPNIYLSKPKSANHLGPPLAPKKEVNKSGVNPYSLIVLKAESPA